MFQLSQNSEWTSEVRLKTHLAKVNEAPEDVKIDVFKDDFTDLWSVVSR